MVKNSANDGEIRPYRSPTASDQPTLSKLHTVRFSYLHVLTMTMALVPIVLWVINEHFSNQHFHDMQERINVRVEQRVTALEEHYASMMEQHAKILGRLDVIQANQQIVLEAIAGVKKQAYGIRKAIEDSP